MTLDIDFIREQFPAFSEPSLQDLAFFENAGGSYACRFVIERLERFYRERKVQPYGPFDASRIGGEEMDEARRRLAEMLGVDPEILDKWINPGRYVSGREFAAAGFAELHSLIKPRKTITAPQVSIGGNGQGHLQQPIENSATVSK